MPQTRICRGVATSIGPEDGYTVVRYHSTDVVKFNRDRVILNHGGWVTATTALRMNQAAAQFNLPYRVHRKDGTMYVRICRDGDWANADCVAITDRQLAFVRQGDWPIADRTGDELLASMGGDGSLAGSGAGCISRRPS